MNLLPGQNHKSQQQKYLLLEESWHKLDDICWCFCDKNPSKMLVKLQPNTKDFFDLVIISEWIFSRYFCFLGSSKNDAFFWLFWTSKQKILKYSITKSEQNCYLMIILYRIPLCILSVLSLSTRSRNFFFISW